MFELSLVEASVRRRATTAYTHSCTHTRRHVPRSPQGSPSTFILYDDDDDDVDDSDMISLSSSSPSTTPAQTSQTSSTNGDAYIPLTNSARTKTDANRYRDDDDEDEDDDLDQDVESQLNAFAGVNGSSKHSNKLRSVLSSPPWQAFNGRSSLITWIVGAFVLFCVAWTVVLHFGAEPFITANQYARHWTLANDDIQSHKLAKWRVPSNTKVVGIVFYGRRRTASVLSCYLERNLKRNGGVLDEVVWMQGTVVPAEVEWMHHVVNQTEGFRTWYNADFAEHRMYKPAYSVIFDEKHKGPVVYVKIDDDIVFVEDIAITSLVHRLLTDAHKPLLVGANVVNQAALAWVHYSMSAIDKYLPELTTSNAPLSEKLQYPEPYWQGPADYTVPGDFRSPNDTMSRWLPVDPALDMPIDNTPISQITTFDPFGNGLMWWPIGAQQHYSFLNRLQRNDINALKFPVWDYNYVRMGIQFYAMRREDIVERFPFPHDDDEHYLSVIATKDSKRRGYVDGRSVVSHYSYGPQVGGMDTTDVFARYRDFAEQHICRSDDGLRFADSL